MADAQLHDDRSKTQFVHRGPVYGHREPDSGRGPHSLEYCLYCYAPLATTSGASQRCPHCGRVHLRIDQASFWSREPFLVRIEWAIKLSIAAAIIGWAMFLNSAHHLGPLTTFLIGPLLMLGGVLWWTAGLITRKSRYFSGRVLWCSSILMLVLGLPILLFVMDVIAGRDSFGSEYWNSYLVLASPALPMILVAIGLHYFCKSYEAFKVRRIASWER